MNNFLKQLFLYGTSFTYSNLSRLFIRLFVGVLFMRFGIRHILYFSNIVNAYPTMLGMSSSTCLIILIVVELLCAFLIMLGLFTRIACVSSVLAMIYASISILAIDRYRAVVGIDDIANLDAMDPVYIPILFIGILIYMILSGPGKISLDYIISLYLIGESNEPDMDELLKDA